LTKRLKFVNNDAEISVFTSRYYFQWRNRDGKHVTFQIWFFRVDFIEFRRDPACPRRVVLEGFSALDGTVRRKEGARSSQKDTEKVNS
jgi:hypothetical protein